MDNMDQFSLDSLRFFFFFLLFTFFFRHWRSAYPRLIDNWPRSTFYRFLHFTKWLLKEKKNGKMAQEDVIFFMNFGTRYKFYIFIRESRSKVF